MNAPVAQNAPSIKVGQALMVGRIERSTRKQGRDGVYFLTLVKLPAPDQFSSPSTVEISSGAALGSKGDEIRQLVSVTGYPRTYSTKPSRDYPDGETVYTADIRLTAVE